MHIVLLTYCPTNSRHFMIDMNNFIPPNPNDPRIALAKAEEKRRKIQMENKKEEDDCMVDIKEKIKEMEGQEMREIMQVGHNSLQIFIFLK